MSDPGPVAALASVLEQVAADLDSWCRSGPAEIVIPLHDALHALHRTILAVRDAETLAASLATAELWVG